MSASSSAPAHLVSMSLLPAARGRASGFGVGTQKLMSLRTRRKAAVGLQRSAGSLKKATRVLGVSARVNVETETLFDGKRQSKAVALDSATGGPHELKLERRSDKENWSQVDKGIVMEGVPSAGDLHGLGFLDFGTSLSSPQLGNWN
jgi:hypothetical protein